MAATTEKRKLLMPVDASPHTLECLKWCVGNGVVQPNDQVFLLHIFDMEELFDEEKILSPYQTVLAAAKVASVTCCLPQTPNTRFVDQVKLVSEDKHFSLIIIGQPDWIEIAEQSSIPVVMVHLTTFDLAVKRKVMMCVDGSYTFRRVFNWAVQDRILSASDAIFLVYAFTDVIMNKPKYQGIKESQWKEELNAMNVTKVARIMKPFATSLSQGKILFTEHALHTVDEGQRLVDAIADLQPDLVICGNSGKRASQRQAWEIGSVSGQILRNQSRATVIMWKGPYESPPKSPEDEPLGFATFTSSLISSLLAIQNADSNPEKARAKSGEVKEDDSACLLHHHSSSSPPAVVPRRESAEKGGGGRSATECRWGLQGKIDLLDAEHKIVGSESGGGGGVRRFDDTGGRKVLIAIDKTEVSQHAFLWGVEKGMVRPTDMIYLFHIHESEDAAESVLEGCVAQCVRRNLWHRILLLPHGSGEIQKQICLTAAQNDFNLVVTGSGGHSKARRLLLGSISGYVAHMCRCPALVIRPHKDLLLTELHHRSKVLIAIKHDHFSTNSFNWAVGKGQIITKDSIVFLVHVTPQIHEARPPNRPAKLWKEYLDQKSSDVGKAVLEPFQRRLTEMRIDFTEHVVPGDEPAPILCRLVGELQPDVVLVGGAARTSPKFASGETTGHVLREATSAVLVCKTEPAPIKIISTARVGGGAATGDDL